MEGKRLDAKRIPCDSSTTLSLLNTVALGTWSLDTPLYHLTRNLGPIAGRSVWATEPLGQILWVHLGRKVESALCSLPHESAKIAGLQEADGHRAKSLKRNFFQTCLQNPEATGSGALAINFAGIVMEDSPHSKPESGIAGQEPPQ